jgi:hypothetical protein
LKVTATTDVVDARFEVGSDTLRVVAGRQELGRWFLSDITAEQQRDGIHIDLAGESIVVNVGNQEEFAAAIAPAIAPSKRRRRRRRPEKQAVREPEQRPVRRPKKQAVRGPKHRAVRRPKKQAVPEPEPQAPEPAPKAVLEPDPHAVLEPEPRVVPEPEPRVIPEPEPRAVAEPEGRAIREPDEPVWAEPGERVLPQPEQRAGWGQRPRAIPELFEAENWERWLSDQRTRLWIISSGVLVFALLALFATSTLGMILVLVGMVALILAALAMSEDLSAYRLMPSAISETMLVVIGAAVMALGAFLIVIG